MLDTDKCFFRRKHTHACSLTVSNIILFFASAAEFVAGRQQSQCGRGSAVNQKPRLPRLPAESGQPSQGVATTLLCAEIRLSLLLPRPVVDHR